MGGAVYGAIPYESISKWVEEHPERFLSQSDKAEFRFLLRAIDDKYRSWMMRDVKAKMKSAKPSSPKK